VVQVSSFSALLRRDHLLRILHGYFAIFSGRLVNWTERRYQKQRIEKSLLS